jgi:hypothetical protein
MRKSDDPTLRNYDDFIASALRTEGGHLSIGRGGFTLFYASGLGLAATTASPSRPTASLPAPPVIDSRMVAFEDVVRLAVSGPMAAVGDEASSSPYRALSYASLTVLANAYRATGAEVFNVPDPAAPAAPEE